MGAFYIFNKNIGLDPNPALDLFCEMGFASPTSFEVGEWMIFVYPKMVPGRTNLISENNCRLISVGTPVYKGKDYTGSLNALLHDFLSDSIDTEQLVGQYTILFCREKTIEILCDPLGSKHLFMDTTHSILSSHMLPICQSFCDNLHINRQALYEKFLTGIIMSPNTFIKEIIQIDQQTGKLINQENIGIQFIQTKEFHLSGSGPKAINESIADQANTLHEYFIQIDNIGLSGGYDSRLGLACLHKFNKGKIHLHSHSTENIHKKDLTIAKQMAGYIGVPCHTVATKKLNHCNQVDEVIRRSILYFDGRSSFSIGGCGEVYTASYREESTEKTPLTLTGVGGELYRNVFDMGIKKVRVEDFLKKKVFSSSFSKAVSETLYQNTCNDIIERVSARLGIDKESKQTKEIAHRYYCEVMMPDGQGVAVDAYNQVSYCIAPFLESRIIAKGYEAIPFHGSGGEFEGKLIDYIDAGLASIPSSYGYPIRKRPIKAKIKERLRILIPASVWNNLSKLLSRGESDFNLSKAFDELYANTQTLKEAYDYLVELFPEINFTWLLHSSEEIRKVQFAAMTLFILKERIKVQ